MVNQVRQKLTMIKRWAKILSGTTEVAVRQGKGKIYSTATVQGYYNDLTGKVSSNTLLDDKGIPLCVIANDNRVHFPIAIFQYALGCYDKYLITSDQEYLDRFRSNVDWAILHQQTDGSWNTFGPIGSTKYSVSSMAQGEGASVLIRAYIQFGDASYLDAARNAIDFMLKPMNEGGTSFYEGENLKLEEYPQDPLRSVLNGWIFSLFGLYDMSLIDSSYMKYFEMSCNTLVTMLNRYDSGYWSYYDMEKRVASPAYHQLHIALLEVMAEISGQKAFAKRQNVFENYAASGFCKTKALVHKVIQKIVEKSDAVVIQ